MRTLRFLALATLVSACGTSPTAFCHRTVDVTCEQIYRCTTEAERAAAGFSGTFGTDQASCVSLQQERSCPANTDEIVCGRHPEWFDGAAGSACLDDIQKASCTASATAYQDSPNCGLVCSPR